MNKNLAIVIIVIIIIALGALYFIIKPGRVSQPLAPAPQGTQQPAPTSGAAAVITNATLTNGIDSSGAPVDSKNVFAADAKDIYAVLSLSGANQHTQIAYIRKYEGKYVESRVSHPSADGIKNFHFHWGLKSSQTRKAGKYNLTFYMNGKKSQAINYIVK